MYAKNTLINKGILRVDMLHESWNHLHDWVFEASEAISGLNGVEIAR